MSHFSYNPLPTDSTKRTQKFTLHDIKHEYEAIRKQKYKEMEIEKVQNNIYLKLYNKKKNDFFHFEKIEATKEEQTEDFEDESSMNVNMSSMDQKCDNISSDNNQCALKRTSNNVHELDTIAESVSDDESNIVDLNNISDTEESEQDNGIYSSKFLDLEAKEASDETEPVIVEQDFEYSQNVPRENSFLKLLEKKYLNRREKSEHEQPVLPIEDISTDSDTLVFDNISTENTDFNMKENKEYAECVKSDIERNISSYFKE